MLRNLRKAIFIGILVLALMTWANFALAQPSPPAQCSRLDAAETFKQSYSYYYDAINSYFNEKGSNDNERCLNYETFSAEIMEIIERLNAPMFATSFTMCKQFGISLGIMSALIRLGNMCVAFITPIVEPDDIPPECMSDVNMTGYNTSYNLAKHSVDSYFNSSGWTEEELCTQLSLYRSTIEGIIEATILPVDATQYTTCWFEGRENGMNKAFEVLNKSCEGPPPGP